MSIKIFFLLISISCMLISCDSNREIDQTIIKKENIKETMIMVVAHPDDETTIGPVLAKYAKDHDVYLIIATDGSYGVTDHAGIPEGEDLVGIRNIEAACSCEALGIHPPIHLGLIDGLGFYARGNFYEQMSMMKEKLNEHFQRLKPSIVLTFGPDGDTGHHDHRLVGNMTAEVLLSSSDYVDTDLYHYGWTEEQSAKFPHWNLGYVSEEYLDTAISFDEEDEQKAFASIRCHESQYTAAELNDWVNLEKRDTSNILYFRKVVRNTTRRTAF